MNSLLYVCKPTQLFQKWCNHHLTGTKCNFAVSSQYRVKSAFEVQFMKVISWGGGSLVVVSGKGNKTSYYNELNITAPTNFLATINWFSRQEQNRLNRVNNEICDSWMEVNVNLHSLVGILKENWRNRVTNWQKNILHWKLSEEICM